MSRTVQELLDKNLPTKKHEDWKYADLSFLKGHQVASVEKENVCEFNAAKKELQIRIYDTSAQARIKAVEGLPRGIRILKGEEFKKTKAAHGLSDFKSYENYLLDLGQTISNDRLYVVIDKEFSSDINIFIWLGLIMPPTDSEKIISNRVSVILEEDASALISEYLSVNEKYFFLSSMDYFLKPGSRARIYKAESGIDIQSDDTAQVDLARAGHTTRLSLQAHAEARMTTLTCNNFWTRHNVFAELCGENAAVYLDGAILTRGNQYADHNTVIEHKVGHTLSSQKYNAVLSGNSKVVFNGKVKIQKDAQKSSAVQLNRNLLLSKKAEVFTKPELQIDADDVQAKHGATVGRLNEEQLFYLVSRGIPDLTAIRMLTRGFVEEIGLQLPEHQRNSFLAEVADHEQEMLKV